MKNKKRKQERQARLERDDFENRIREAQTTHRHIDRTKVLLGSGGDVASDSEDEFDEAYQGQFGEVLEKEALFKPEKSKQHKEPEHTGVNRKEKTLVLTSRGVVARFRHLMQDLLCLLPNAKKDAKIDSKNDKRAVVECAELRGSNNAIFFESRKRQDSYAWFAKTPEGPSIKFHVENIHTMAELKLTGNHLKFSRPSLHFDPKFDDEMHTRVIKEILVHCFATPWKHHAMKPFYDHQMSFYWEDGRVWFRNYQIVHPEGKEVRANFSSIENGVSSGGLSLTEVGPRFCLHPIKIFQGAFTGKVLYEDELFVNPNVRRADAKKKDSDVYARKVAKKQKRKAHVAMNQLKRREDDLDGFFRDDDAF
jgi:ribosome biogenesis protein BRX1